MKKQKIKLFRLIFSGAVASALCVFLAHYVLFWLWSFDIFSKKQWSVIARFWNNNGVIFPGRDYLFFLTLFLLFLCGILLWVIFYRFDLKGILISSIRYFLNRDLRRYQNEDLHVKLKNMAPSEKKTLKEFIDEKMKAAGIEKKEKGALVNSVREKIRKKFLHKEE